MSDQNKNNFAVIRLNSKQFIVKQGSRIKADRVSEGAVVEVLLAEIDGTTYFGEPLVGNVGVRLEITEEKKDAKIEVRRYKSKSKYRKHKGHRQPISMIYVAGVALDGKNEITWNLKTEDDAISGEVVNEGEVSSEAASTEAKASKK